MLVRFYANISIQTLSGIVNQQYSKDVYKRQLLDIAKSGGNPTVSIGVISVEGHADLSITAGVHFACLLYTTRCV